MDALNTGDVTDDVTTLEIPCVLCQEKITVKVPTSGYHKWRYGGALIQEAMPTVSVDDREMLISQTCPACWKKMEEH